MARQFELVDKVKAYDPLVDEEALNRAYVFAMSAHGAQLRASGDPYFSHPVEVANILADMHVDSATLITALLHDTVEDTDVTLEDIKSLFGNEVAELVDGVTKLSQIESKSASLRRAENFRKLVLAMSKDIRVLLVKLADRLHNMRTLGHIKNPEKRQQKSLETLEIYVPLADRIGIHKLKNELEDLAFREIYPEARISILKRLEQLRSEGENTIENIIHELQTLFQNAEVEVQVAGREKTPFSIWHKMQKKNLSFEALTDIMAFRVVVDSVENCYRALGIVHSQYRVVPGRFKDYISTPKPNNYRSIHTSILGPQQKRIEIQIRTQDMQDVAEWGVAAHWHYKNSHNSGPIDKEKPQYRWLRNLMQMLEQSSGAEEFLEHSKLEMFQDQVFCFTPKGDLIALPKGATTVDFAYEVHTEVGNHCVGAKINGRLLPLKTVLENGDQVEIMTSSSQKPSPSWADFAVTGKAKSCIFRFMQGARKSQFIELGKSILQRFFEQKNQSFKEKMLIESIKNYRVKDVEDVYAQIGEGILHAKDIFHVVLPSAKIEEENLEKNKKIIDYYRTIPPKKRSSVTLEGLIPGMAIHMAGCCHPLPGDRIVGIVSTGKGVNIHTIDCENLEKYTHEPQRWIDVSWSKDEEKQMHVARIHVVLSNEPGTLAALSVLIGKNNANITNLKITNRTQEYFEIIVDIEVRDVQHLSHIMAILRSSPVIHDVTRQRG
jgi:GTP diphosphokinase / guanosine-3',5'-bis(diphosphate) 3'-diphosphatase